MWCICGWSLNTIIDKADGDIYKLSDVIINEIDNDNPYLQTMLAVRYYNDANVEQKALVDKFFSNYIDCSIREFLQDLINDIEHQINMKNYRWVNYDLM